MDFPSKPTNSAALLHYLFQLPHRKVECTAKSHKLATWWKVLFQFEVDVGALPPKPQITQFAMVTRALFYFYQMTPNSQLATKVMVAQSGTISRDEEFLAYVRQLVDQTFTKEELQQLYQSFSRPIGGGPVHAELHRKHQERAETMAGPHFRAWTAIASMAGDTNTAFKSSTMRLLPPELAANFEKHHLKKGKAVVKARARPKPLKPFKRSSSFSSSSSSSSQLTKKTKKTKKPQPKSSIYPDPPEGGWMAIMLGTALGDFVARLTPIAGEYIQLQMVRYTAHKVCMLMHTGIKDKFFLQVTADTALFESQVEELNSIVVEARELANVAKPFTKTSICILFHPNNPEMDHQPTLTFASVQKYSSMSFVLQVRAAATLPMLKKPHLFHGLATVSINMNLLKPIVSVDKVDTLKVCCEVNRKHRRIFITLRAFHRTKNKLAACHQFSAELDDSRISSSSSSSPSDSSTLNLFDVNDKHMHTGKIVASASSNITNIRAYNASKKARELESVFIETYPLGLLKALVKALPKEQIICLVMTSSGELLMTINDYRGNVQVVQKPEKTNKTEKTT